MFAGLSVADILATVRAAYTIAGNSESDVEAMVQTAQATIDDIEADLLTLEQVHAEFGIQPDTVRKWIDRGRLQAQPRLRFPARGGGKLRVSRRDIQRILQNPPRPGRPKRSDQS